VLRRLGEWLFEPRFSIAGVAALVTATVLFGNFLLNLRSEAAETAWEEWRALLLTPEPEVCALCETGATYDGPCLVSLATGEVGQLETSWAQDGNYVRYFGCAGLSAVEDLSTHTCEVTLPEESDPMNAAYFCRDCRAKLAEIATAGYVLADLQDTNDFRLYPIAAGAAYEICGHAVTVSQDAKTERLTVFAEN